MHSPFLIGPSVYLRPLEPADAQPLAAWLNDAEVTRHLRRYQPMTLAEEEGFLRRVSESATDLVLGIALRADDRLVGATGLHNLDARNRHAEFGIFIGDKSVWGKGHGTEATRLVLRHAFDTLNLHRVWLHVYEYNEAGLRLYQKVGFRTEGRLRQDNFRDGRYWDTLVMALLGEEWQAVACGSTP
jgi:ribosomal-protein-alanine N-acetyltransferase